MTREVADLKAFLVEKRHEPPTPEPEKILTIKEAAELLHLAVPTLYTKVSRGELPAMKRGKRLYFSRVELVEYLKKGRKATNAEVRAEVGTFLTQKK